MQITLWHDGKQWHWEAPNEDGPEPYRGVLKPTLDSLWVAEDAALDAYQKASDDWRPKWNYDFVQVEPPPVMSDEEWRDSEMNDMGDPGDMDGDTESALASAGMGTDEDYGYAGDFDNDL